MLMVAPLPLFIVMVEGDAKPMAVPPEMIIPPEPEANVMSPEDTLPLTVTVPAASPVAPLPKLRASVVAVVTLPGSVAPVESVLHPCELLPVVGAAHVPPAVPKPAVPPLLSQ